MIVRRLTARPNGWIFLAVAILAALGALAPVFAPWSAKAAPGAAPENERRVALVIGVGGYQNAPHLANPVNDARAIAESLRRLKFEVTELYDPDFRVLNSGVRVWGALAATADEAVVYFAGHGVQVNRENYLIPVDAKLERERDLLYEALPLDRLLGEVSQASRVGIVLLDSCRNNPFLERIAHSTTAAGRSVATTQGLARVDNLPRNTMLVMAAKPDQVSEEGEEHSPFAAALLAHLQIPGLELSLFFRSVRDTVQRATNNRQEPSVFSSLGGEPFYFYPRPPNRPPEIGAVTPLEVTESAGPMPLDIPQPTDPDQDPLTVRIIGLPRTGEVTVEGRPVTVNTVVSAEHFKTAQYKPDGKTLGPAGTLDILIEDGRGGSVAANLPVSVRSSHHAPVLAGPRRVEVAQQLLGISAPVSPDGDPLVITITAVPRGAVRNGATVVHTGDHVSAQELANLTFAPDGGFTGAAGTLSYSVDNGHGGVVAGSTDVDVVASPAAAATEYSSETAAWDKVRGTNDPKDLSAFMRLFPASPHIEEAKQRRKTLEQTANPPAAAKSESAKAETTKPESAKPEQAKAEPLRTEPEKPQGAAAAKPELAKPEPEKPQVATKPVAEPSPAKPAAKPKVIVAGAAESAFPNAPHPEQSVMTATNGPIVVLPSSPPQPTPTEISRFQDCPTCPSMVRIPGGSFTMGQGSHEPESAPAHHVDIRAFALGQSPVTVGEWKACMEAKACKFLPRMRVAENRTPVHNLSWDDISEYMDWLSATTGHTYRLPSEAEWEYAARGGTATQYWWGDSVGVSLANCSDCGGTQDQYGPLPVDALQPNPFGLYDMLGGVAEWTADCWFPNYRGAPADARPRSAKNCERRVLRGGSFREPHEEITVTYRGNYDAPVRYLVNGFRVARDLE